MKSLLLLLILSIALFPACKTAKNKKKNPVKVEKTLHGNWELTYISSEEDLFSFEELYPEAKPTLSFDLKGNAFSGNTSCNNFSGALKTEANKIDFKEDMGMTRMLCEGVGEAKFLEKLKKVDAYSISEDNVLALLENDIAILRFARK